MTHITVAFLYSPTIPVWLLPLVYWTVPLKVKVLGQTVGGGGGGGGGSACIGHVRTHSIIIVIVQSRMELKIQTDDPPLLAATTFRPVPPPYQVVRPPLPVLGYG